MSPPKPSTVVLILAACALVMFFVVSRARSSRRDSREPLPTKEDVVRVGVKWRAKLGEGFVEWTTVAGVAELRFSGCTQSRTEGRSEVVLRKSCAGMLQEGLGLSRRIFATSADGFTIQMSPRLEAVQEPFEERSTFGDTTPIELVLPSEAVDLVVHCDRPADDRDLCAVEFTDRWGGRE